MQVPVCERQGICQMRAKRLIRNLHGRNKPPIFGWVNSCVLTVLHVARKPQKKGGRRIYYTTREELQRFPSLSFKEGRSSSECVRERHQVFSLCCFLSFSPPLLQLFLQGQKQGEKGKEREKIHDVKVFLLRLFSLRIVA